MAQAGHFLHGEGEDDSFCFRGQAGRLVDRLHDRQALLSGDQDSDNLLFRLDGKPGDALYLLEIVPAGVDDCSALAPTAFAAVISWST